MSDKRLTTKELAQTPEYQQLTNKQKLFVLTYVGSGMVDGNYNGAEAALTAYKCKSRESARIMSYSLLANIKIVAVLNRHFSIEPREEFLALLDRAIRNKKLTMAQLGALKLKCDILNIKTNLPSAPRNIEDKQEQVGEEIKEKRKASRQEKALAKPAEPFEEPDDVKGIFS
jgi:hypothetical protein